MIKIAIVATAGVLLMGCGALQIGVAGSGKESKETRSLPPFHKIVLKGSADVELVCGKDGPAEVTADDNILAIIETKVKDGELVISPKQSYSTDHPVRIRLHAAHLDSASLAGSGNIQISHCHEENLSLAISGSGNIEAAGNAAKLDVSIEGSGNLKAKALNTSAATISISGSGDAEVFTAGPLQANVEGSGNVSYFGHPSSISKSIAGSGDVKAGG